MKNIFNKITNTKEKHIFNNEYIYEISNINHSNLLKIQNLHSCVEDKSPKMSIRFN